MTLVPSKIQATPNNPHLWSGLLDFFPSLCLFVVIVVPPFAGTIALYRTAMFLLMAFTLVSLFRNSKKIDKTVQIIVLLGAAFTFWSLLSAIFGIDPKYSLRRWQSEHLIVFLFLCAIILNPCRYHLPFILWGGIISTCLIALGVSLDQALIGKHSDVVRSLILWKIVFVHGFSSDITWVTSHLMLVHWIGLTALMLASVRRPLFWGGLISTLAGLWLSIQTFQVMAFFVIYFSTFVFLAIMTCKKFGKKGTIVITLLLFIMLGGLVYRDLILYPNKKVFRGTVEVLKTGKTKNLHLQSRINGVCWAIHKCQERPLLGWGPGREILRKVEPTVFNITEQQVPDFNRHPPLGHLHNQLADLLIRVGIPGLFFYSAFLLMIFLNGIRLKLWKENWIQNPGAGFQLGALIGSAFFVFRLLTETYPASSVGAQYWMILAFAVLSSKSWKDGSGFFAVGNESSDKTRSTS